MRTRPISPFVKGIFGLILILGALATMWLLVSLTVVRIAQHNKSLRPTLLKPYNKIIRPIAGRPHSPYA
ncbi:hypothetical protein, partial [Mycobacterium sp.]|uniref:hypothetical protein n=1 Tax=Mycobacterium sp. TaxID=1785 RepID=UPI003F95EE6F